ncbi:MAG: CopG family transcriptional regulator [Peptoanaerobacter stomatis]|uniref:CopG family transcriptional regulator n=1 Tax=Peptoanaerobacter stomatis TaxID=796937 RepID=UPI003FA12A5F
MGRPKKNSSPRTEKLTLRLSQDELSDIKYCADKIGLSRTDTIVKSIKDLKNNL